MCFLTDQIDSLTDFIFYFLFEQLKDCHTYTDCRTSAMFVAECALCAAKLYLMIKNWNSCQRSHYRAAAMQTVPWVD